MARASGSPDSRHSISEALRISPANRDARGPDNLIPLSPQWLLPKPGEKSGVGSGEDHLNPFPAFGSNHQKLSTASEEGFDVQKKKDVFRPSLLDMESGRRERWRDEERDTNSSIRRDHWRNTDKEHGESRRMERWADHNSSGKNNETRRVPSDRWNEASHREVNYDQRRESKWNTRWGPDDKEVDASREKWMDSGKDGDILVDRAILSPTLKEEKESENHRPWRLSTSYSRGRGEPLHHPAALSSKQMPAFSYNRGRGENPSAFSSGRGRSQGAGLALKNNFSTHATGNFMEKGESYPLQYSRAKLLFVYKKTDMNLEHELVNDFVHVASLTQDKPNRPIALCAPNADEADVLDGIEKGEIVTSGAPQLTKDGSVAKNSADLSFSRRAKLGGKEDAAVYDNPKEEISDRSKTTHGDFIMGLPKGRIDDAVKQQLTSHVNDPLPVVTQWQSSSLQDQLLPVTECGGVMLSDYRAQNSVSGSGWSETPKNFDKQWDPALSKPLISNSDVKWQSVENPLLKRQISSVMEREQERPYSAIPPENLILYYKDPQDEIQGPFSGSDIIGWFETGYFGLDLKVRYASAPKEAPFLELGDMMPHLRAKAGPPPGFDAVKQSEILDHLGKQPFVGFSNSSSGLSNVDTAFSSLKSKSGSSTEAENRFLESLMTGSISNSSQGFHGFNLNSSVGLPSPKIDVGNDPYLLAKRMVLESQRSSPNPYPFWPGRDAIPIGSLPAVSDTKFIASPVDNLHQLPNFPAQGLSERSASGAHSLGGSWPKFSGSMDQHQDTSEFFNLQNVPGQPSLLQQRGQNSIPNSLTDLHGQSLDNTANILTPEKLLAAGLPPDPQVLNLLQQQYLVQLQTQASLSAQPMSVLDKLFLLKQQQKQEEQQQLLRQHHHQQLLSQALSEQRSHLHFSEPSYVQLQSTGFDGISLSSNSSRISQPSELVGGSEMTVPKERDYASDSITTQHMAQNVSYAGDTNVQSFSSLNQAFGVDSKQGWERTVQPMDNFIQKESVPEVSYIGNSHGLSDKTVQHQDFSRSRHLNHDVIERQTKGRVSEFGMNVGECAADVSDNVQKLKLSSGDESSTYDQVEIGKERIENLPAKPLVEPQIDENQIPATAIKAVESREKKSSEKKPKKQKPAKSASALLKASPVRPNQMDMDETSNFESKIVSSEESSATACKNSLKHMKDVKLGSLDGNSPQESLEHTDPKIDSKTDVETQLTQCAWKPAPGFRAKSIVEIQLEEQIKTQSEIPVPDVSSIKSAISTPWAGVVVSSDIKQRNPNEISVGKLHDLSPSAITKKSQLHDLFPEESLAKATDLNGSNSDSARTVLLQQSILSASEPADDEQFIEAKETKKGRKKSGKAKTGGTKLSVSPSVDVPVSVSEKSKSSRISAQDKEVLPAAPSGPSLADFVVWKGESVSQTPSLAWCTDSKKVPKPTSLRDIQKEQEKVSRFQPPIQIPSQKQQANQGNRGGNSSWTPASSPSKATSTTTVSSISANSKSKVDDELFWGPSDQTKHDAKQSEYPDLTSQGTWGSKGAPVKSPSSGLMTKQKSSHAKLSERSISSPSVKGRKDAMNKHSEAMDFRDWCETECERLIGTKDTSFLEFCLSQSRSEAELFLIENLGSYDPGHEFIDKFLNYKDLLSAEVLEIAFRSSQTGRKPSGRDAISNTAGPDSYDHEVAPLDDSSKSGGKKKGKKGKKVNPSVLGFNVVSNRIMMGEIQTIEE